MQIWEHNRSSSIILSYVKLCKKKRKEHICMNYILQGFGVFLGVIAGVVVLILFQWYIERKKESQKVKNLKFEFELNIKKIDKWLEEINKYRNAVNGDSFNNYFGYFNLSRFINVTGNDLFVKGLLYKYLDYDDIGKLQVIYSEFTLQGENFLNNQIVQNRNQVLQQPTSWPALKSKVVLEVDFWDNKFQEHKKTLEDILKKLA